jgi:hypothetical protein
VSKIGFHGLIETAKVALAALLKPQKRLQQFH